MKKDALYRAALGLDRARLRFATFKAVDVPLNVLRGAGQAIMAAGRQVLKALKVDGHALSLEASFEDWHDGYHCHAHALVATPSGGRQFISRQTWNDAWLSALPSELRPLELSGAAHVKPVRDVERACYYTAKSPFFQVVAEREAVAKTLAAVHEMKGLPRYECRGSLAVATAPCAG